MAEASGTAGSPPAYVLALQTSDAKALLQIQNSSAAKLRKKMTPLCEYGIHLLIRTTWCVLYCQGVKETKWRQLSLQCQRNYQRSTTWMTLNPARTIAHWGRTAESQFSL